MLLANENRNVSSAGVMQVARATIKTSPKIFNFFADQTYANKPKAITRELAANAVDSHVMAGKPDLPVEVWLPTLLDPVFRVRDHGLGMDHEFMMTQFMCYADGSTKDASNEAIGGFGIGSKSPFAYVDQYTVTSRFDGTESVYSVFKDEDGIPAIGLLGQRDTTEPNGVEVSFPVKPEDFETFEKAAFEALRYFQPLPLIKNAVSGAFEPPAYIASGDTWGMREQAGDLAIIMGGVRYPVDTNNLTYKFPADSAARKLLKYGLDLRLPIGTCSVALSREALSYDDRTIEAIRNACESVIDEVAESFATMFDHITSPWEVRVALHKEVGPNSYSERSKFLAEHAKWHGDPFEIHLDYPLLGSRETARDGEVYRYAGYEVWNIDSRNDRRTRRGRVIPVGSAKWEYPDIKRGFIPGAVAHLVIDDLPQSPKHKAIKKIKEFCEDVSGKVLVIRPQEHLHLEVQDIIDAFGKPPEGVVVLTSSMPEPIMERAYKKNTDRPKVRMFTFDGRRRGWNENSDNINPGPYGKTGVEEIAYADQPDEGILVVCEQFNIPGDLREIMDSQLLSWRDLRFVNAGDAKKLSKGNWVGYRQEFERLKKEKLAAYPELPQRLALSNEHCLKHTFDFFRRNPNTDFSSRKPLGQIFTLYKRYVEPLTDEQRRLARFTTAKLPRGVKPQELVDKLRTKQAKAWRLMGLLPSHTELDAEDLKLFLENL